MFYFYWKTFETWAFKPFCNVSQCLHFTQVLKEQQNARKDREAQRIRMMNADPFDLEAQRLIATEIEQKNIDQNMELAMEARLVQVIILTSFNGFSLAQKVLVL